MGVTPASKIQRAKSKRVTINIEFFQGHETTGVGPRCCFHQMGDAGDEIPGSRSPRPIEDLFEHHLAIVAAEQDGTQRLEVLDFLLQKGKITVGGIRIKTIEKGHPVRLCRDGIGTSRGGIARLGDGN